MVNSYYTRWQNTLEAIKLRHPEVKLVNKKTNVFSKLIAKILFFTKYQRFWTTIYPKIYVPDTTFDGQHNAKVLQHEWVHLEDAATMFGLLRWMPWEINSVLFGLLYLFPLPLALLSLLAFWNPLWLLALVFLLPVPAPIRMIAEVRAYRRSVELGDSIELTAEKFTGSSYYFMWPFKKHVSKLLAKPSPYKAMMDDAWKV